MEKPSTAAEGAQEAVRRLVAARADLNAQNGEDRGACVHEGGSVNQRSRAGVYMYIYICI